MFRCSYFGKMNVRMSDDAMDNCCIGLTLSHSFFK